MTRVVSSSPHKKRNGNRCRHRGPTASRGLRRRNPAVRRRTALHRTKSRRPSGRVSLHCRPERLRQVDYAATDVGLLAPSEGEIRVEGRPAEEMQENFAFVFQNPRVVPWRNAVENVCLAATLRYGTSKRNAMNRAIRELGKVGLSKDTQKMPAMMSGGERQRVSIAPRPMVDPKIVLMDEPFSALDLRTRALMRDEILALWKETRKTVIFVTHDVEEALILADRIAVLSQKPTRLIETIAIDAPVRAMSTPIRNYCVCAAPARSAPFRDGARSVIRLRLSTDARCGPVFCSPCLSRGRSTARNMPPYLIPSPLAVAQEMGSLIVQPGLRRQIWRPRFPYLRSDRHFGRTGLRACTDRT